MKENEQESLRRRQRPAKSPWNAWDHALIKAKRDNAAVSLLMAVDTSWVDGNFEAIVHIEHVDVYAVHVRLANGRKVWVSKAHIVATEVVDSE